MELLPGSDITTAIEAYTSISRLLSQSSGLSPPTPAYLSNITPPTPKLPFEARRELYRWISSCLSRAAILSAQRQNTVPQTVLILRTYHAYSAHWPASFRPIQRQRMLLLYLRALYTIFPSPATPCDSPYMLDPSVPSPTTDARTAWRAEVSEALRQGQNLLSATTSFPRAGSVNHPVIAFVDLCVSLADKCPLLDRETISILWWAMSYTFQSPSVLRHLTRLLASVGDSDDARRIFELYVRLVLKDRETHQPEVSLQLKRRPTEGLALSPEEIHQEVVAAEEQNGTEQEEKATQKAEAETESDENFIGALLVGARVLLRNLGDAEEAWSYVTLAGDVVRHVDRKRPGALKDLVRAEVEECKGIILMAMGMRGKSIPVGANCTLLRSTSQAAIPSLGRRTRLNPSIISALLFASIRIPHLYSTTSHTVKPKPDPSKMPPSRYGVLLRSNPVTYKAGICSLFF